MRRKHRPPTDYITCKHCGKDYRAITVWHLRKVHGYKGEHPVNDYKRKYRLGFALCPDSRKRIKVAKIGYWTKRGQHWTKTSLLAAIRRIHRTDLMLNKQTVPVRVELAGRRLFGTWEAAVEAAGLDYEQATGVRRWNQEKIVAAIQKFARGGVPLTAKYVAAHDPMLLNAATKQFPSSWAKALRAAGFDPDEHKTPRGRWNQQLAEDWVRKRFAKGKPILAGDAPTDLLNFVYRQIDTSWQNFVESLGITYPGIKKRHDWTKRIVLEEMRRWAAEGRRMNYKAVQLAYQALLQQAKKFFGTWDRARESARV